MALAMNPKDPFAHHTLTLIYAYQNRLKEARYHASELVKINPYISIKRIANNWPHKDKEAIIPTMELYRKAGIPEG